MLAAMRTREQKPEGAADDPVCRPCFGQARSRALIEQVGTTTEKIFFVDCFGTCGSLGRARRW